MKQLFIFLVIIGNSTLLFAQNKPVRTVAEATITYAITLADSSTGDESFKKTLNETEKTVYIKGNNSRVDVVAPTFSQSVVYNKTTGTAFILREIGNNKFLTNISKESWLKRNANLADAKIEIDANDKKNILGYECIKATITYKDNTVVTAYYTSAFAPSVKEFEYQFKDLPGMVMQYVYTSAEFNNRKLVYTAVKINLTPVLASKFELPSTGYRILKDE
jgi:GLPGLI family protein